MTPHAVQSALQQASRQRAIAIFIDDRDGRVLFADTIKALSDRVVASTAPGLSM